MLYVISGLALVYLVLCAGVWFLQDAMIFPGAGGPDEELVVPDGVSVGELSGADGEPFRVATSMPVDPAAVVLFFVGNGENLHSGVLRAEDLAAYGVAAIVPEYPGYGRSDGRASYESLMQVAEVAGAHARQIADQLGVDLVVAGSSLGTFMAVQLAARGVGDRLLLKAPPTSMLAMGEYRLPFLPVGWLLRHPFDSLAQAGAVGCPALVVHGEADAIVPPSMGRELADAIAGESRYLPVPEHGHNHPTLSTRGPIAGEVRAFLQGR